MIYYLVRDGEPLAFPDGLPEGQPASYIGGEHQYDVKHWKTSRGAGGQVLNVHRIGDKRTGERRARLHATQVAEALNLDKLRDVCRKASIARNAGLADYIQARAAVTATAMARKFGEHDHEGPDGTVVRVTQAMLDENHAAAVEAFNDVMRDPKVARWARS